MTAASAPVSSVARDSDTAAEVATAATAAGRSMPTSGWLLLCCGASLLLGGLGGGLWLLLDRPEPLQLAWDAVR